MYFYNSFIIRTYGKHYSSEKQVNQFIFVIQLSKKKERNYEKFKLDTKSIKMGRIVPYVITNMTGPKNKQFMNFVVVFFEIRL